MNKKNKGFRYWSSWNSDLVSLGLTFFGVILAFSYSHDFLIGVYIGALITLYVYEKFVFNNYKVEIIEW